MSGTPPIETIDVDVRIDPAPDDDVEPEPKCGEAEFNHGQAESNHGEAEVNVGEAESKSGEADSPKLAVHVRSAVRAAAAHRGFDRGSVSVWVTDDANIHRVNRESLSHDYPTDVISFDYRDPDGASNSSIDGELIVSHQTAAAMARRHGVNVRSELLLYVIHGTLHITGMEDATPPQRRAMRSAETAIMVSIGLPDADRMRVDDLTDATCGSPEDAS